MTGRWAVIQLSPESEGVNADVLVATLRGWYSADVRVTEGYALVRHAEARRLNAEHRFVDGPMRLAGGALYTLSDLEVARLTRGRPVRRGLVVRILTGPYRGLTGRIEKVKAEEVSVRVVLRSVQPLVTVPRDKVEHAAE